MKDRKEFPLALKEFAREIGVPTKLILDHAGEHGSGVVRKFAKECSMAIHLLEESTQWADLAERYIGILKSAVLKDLHDSFCPMRLWCYAVEYRTAVHNVTAQDTFKLGGLNPYMVTMDKRLIYLIYVVSNSMNGYTIKTRMRTFLNKRGDLVEH